MNILERPNRKGDKITFYYDYGRGRGQRLSTGIFIYTRPKNQTEKNHNKQAKDLLDVKKSQLIIEQQAIGTGFIPAHKFKANFLEYFEEYVKLNKREGNRHLTSCPVQFKEFISCDYISPIDVTENLCKKKRTNGPINSKLFQIPGRNGCNKILDKWIKAAAIQKHITWSCARLSFSILLQDKNVDDATVAALLGHTTTTQVRKVYKRHRPKDQTETIKQIAIT